MPDMLILFMIQVNVIALYMTQAKATSSYTTWAKYFLDRLFIFIACFGWFSGCTINTYPPFDGGFDLVVCLNFQKT